MEKTGRVLMHADRFRMEIKRVDSQCQRYSDSGQTEISEDPFMKKLTPKTTSIFQIAFALCSKFLLGFCQNTLPEKLMETAVI